MRFVSGSVPHTRDISNETMLRSTQTWDCPISKITFYSQLRSPSSCLKGAPVLLRLESGSGGFEEPLIFRCSDGGCCSGGNGDFPVKQAPLQLSIVPQSSSQGEGANPRRYRMVANRGRGLDTISAYPLWSKVRSGTPKPSRVLCQFHDRFGE